MINDTLNPYASPAVPTEPGPEYERRTIQGSFEVDERVQRAAARAYQISDALILTGTLLAIPVCIIAAFQFDLSHWGFAVIYGFFGGAIAAVFLHVALDWTIFFRNLRQLRQHPILGALGTWRIQIDEQQIVIATARGQQQWRIDDVRRMELNQSPMVMWLEREASIALPKDGDYFEDDYAAVRKTLRHRVMHVGGPYVKYLLGLLPGNFGGSIQPEGDGRSSGE